VFATNRSLDQVAGVQIQVADRNIAVLESAELLTGPGAKAANSFEQPNDVQAQPFAEAHIVDGQSEMNLPPLSVTALTFRLG
jgi:alpha-L-arabinofuranosidase